jgi:hypothetical protein
MDKRFSRKNILSLGLITFLSILMAASAAGSLNLRDSSINAFGNLNVQDNDIQSVNTITGAEYFNPRLRRTYREIRINDNTDMQDNRLSNVSDITFSEDIAIGDLAGGLGTDSMAVGNGAVSNGARSTALGNNALTTASGTTAVGNSAEASGDYSTAIGNNVIANKIFTTAVGDNADATAQGAQAFGTGAEATASGSVALGKCSLANEQSTVEIGGGSDCTQGTTKHLKVNGDFQVVGSKNFVEKVNETHNVVYSSQESGEVRAIWEESGVLLEDGAEYIKTPDHFQKVTAEKEPMIVHVTPESPVAVGAEEKSNKGVMVRTSTNEDVRVDITVKGIRKGFEEKEIIERR